MPVVIGSTWFWPVYFIVSFIGCVLIKKGINSKKLLVTAIVCYGVTLTLWYITRSLLVKQVVKLIFYFAIYMFGYESFSWKIPKKVFLIVELAAIAISLPAIFSLTTPMSEAKAPPIITYAAFSLIVIFASIYLKKPILKKNLLTWVGQNCLMFYFAQGISSSILYYIVPALGGLNWIAKFIVCAAINMVMAFAIAAVLKKYYGFFDWVIRTVRSITKEQKTMG